MRQQGSKSVLVIDYYFPPSAGAGVHRTLGYVRHLAEFGWHPVVLTPEHGEHYFYDASLLQWIPPGLTVRRTRSIEPERFVKRILMRTMCDGDRPNHGGGPPETRLARQAWLRSWLMFPDRRIGWFPFAVGAALRLGRRVPIDVIYSTSTAVTSHLVAYTLKTLWRKPWVADFQDPWTEEYDFSFPSPAHRRAALAIERLIVRHADRVTMTTGPMREIFRRKHPMVESEKLQVIPMGFDPQALVGIQRIPRERFTITHFGNFYGTRSPAPFLRALGACAKRAPMLRGRVEVLFFGSFDPRMRNVAESLVEEHALGDMVHLRDSVSYREGMQHLMNSDVLLLVADAGGNGQCLIPSKLFEYFAVGRPILALAPPGAIAELMREANAGLVVSPDDEAAIEKAILALYDRWRRDALTNPPNRDFVATCTWQARTAQFAVVLDAAVNRRAPAVAFARSEGTS